MPPLPEWAKRAQRAHNNSVENLVIFGGFILIAKLIGVSNGATQMAAMAYFWLRALQWIAYFIGITYLRSMLWVGSWVCQLVLAAQILMHSM
jgi:uncharacterized MAPEG superfamily protein